MAYKPTAPRLRAYVRRTILASATSDAYPRKRRTPESTRCAFSDAMRGTDTGWWCDLIYTRDLLTMANRYRNDTRAVLREFMSETGAGLSDPVQTGQEAMTFADLVTSTSQRWTFADYDGSNGKANEAKAEAATFALRFAVEYLAGDLARKYCPDL